MLISGCGNSINKTSQKLSGNMVEEKGLFAKLTLKDTLVAAANDVIISVSILNQGLKDIELPQEQVLTNKILSLTVLNINGDTLLSGPPVTPKNDSISCYKRVLKPNEKCDFEFVGVGAFSPALSKGKYMVAMRLMPSNRIWFEIK